MNNIKKVLMSIALTLGTGAIINTAQACTRVIYKGTENLVMTGRNMDFSLPIPANLWLFPRGMDRDGSVGPHSVQWKSKYGSLIASSWDIATTDGMNEKGLVANLLWLLESRYPESAPSSTHPGLAISMWAQYVLDNFATVAESVEQLSKESFVVVTDMIPGTQKMTTVHMSISDATGDSAILEYIDGKLVIHHNPDYLVMTNDPPYPEQLAIQKYWQTISGSDFMPGTVKSSDRFVRANYFINNTPKTDDERVATAVLMSIMRHTSVPYGYSIAGHPNLSSTQWRVVADQTNLRYTFETVLSPNTFWVDLKQLDFSESSSAKMLDVSSGQIYAGEVSAHFHDAKPFKFQGLAL
ncbi:linear amide C-N hydrolase [Photobacterium ganghwense]|uniref:linear amide C-N hydrolase n=1 Tax=Photobacterium ganghwense TaxID=320778 RepID=UPI0039EF0F7A